MKPISLQHVATGICLFYDDNGSEIEYTVVNRNGTVLRKGLLPVTKDLFYETVTKAGYRRVRI
jgi:hypothetical protein